MFSCGLNSLWGHTKLRPRHTPRRQRQGQRRLKNKRHAMHAEAMTFTCNNVLATLDIAKQTNGSDVTEISKECSEWSEKNWQE